MPNQNNSKKQTPRLRVGASPVLFLLAGALAFVAPLRADNPPTYLFKFGSYGSGNGQFEYPDGVVLDSSNDVYVLDEYNACVEKFDGNGNYLTKWGSGGSANGQFTYPYGIALDSNNNVYVVDTGNARVEKFTRNGAYFARWGSGGTNNGQFTDPNGIAIDSSNNVYVLDSGNCRIQKFNTIGGYLTKWGTYGTGDSQFENPGGIAVDGSNNVYVVDTGNNRVEKFASDGSYLTQWGSMGGGNGQFESPQGIALDSSNNVYVVDTASGRVQKFTSDGSYLTQWGSPGNGNGQFEGPQGIALGGGGNIIYVADSSNVRIQVFANSVTQLPPYISSEPASQTVVAGVTVSFSVSTIGGEPMTYQWTADKVALPNATNSALTITNVSLAVTATYDLLVTNDFGNAASTNFVLTVEPAFAYTLPATEVGDTGAVLNSSITVGEDTIAWFNWGANTNYGNSTATTVISGATGTTNLSATLSGLTVNTYYHYQIVASNISGVVYGDDQSFEVAHKVPTVTTLAMINGPSGPTLTGSVNPNGLDTTAYFIWGPSRGIQTNLTTITNIGSGPIPVDVSLAVTGVAPAGVYNFHIVASNSLGTVVGATAQFYGPAFASVPLENWDSVASSADGSVLVAVANEVNGASPAGPILISTNSGTTWSIATGAPTNGWWETVACSADGSKMIAAGGGAGSAVFPIYTSSDMGATWLSNNAPVINWQSVASSPDGTRLVAAAELNQVIYTSTNSGATWTQAANAPNVSWFSVALSADGTKLAAVASGSTNIYTSPDFGVTWVTNKVPAVQGVIQRGWSSVASSADGGRLIASVGGNGASGYIFLSTNSGTDWRLTATNIFGGLGAHPWIGVASSADGSRLAAVSDAFNTPLGVIITSTNSGATWTTNAVPFLSWNAVALSADGAKLVASVGYPSTGPIYVSQTTRGPELGLSTSESGPVISWTIPSQDFTLQRSSDLASWTDVTNQPELNLTNLHHEVTLPLPDGNTFYRLAH